MATTTKCMSKMLKKELYEYCKTLIKENQKLQLFNNSQEEEIEKINKNYLVECEISGEELKEGIEKLEQEIEELKLEIKQFKKQQEIILLQNDILLKSNEDMGERISELEEHLEYFQNKCEIMEKELIEKEED